jgi:hypothetical protein
LNADPNSPAYLAILNEVAGVECVGPFYTIMLNAEIAIQKVLIKAENPTWSDTQVATWAYMKATGKMLLEKVHLTLDVVGLVPGAGEIADISNGVIYTLEGDGINAGLSYAGAIPFAGWASTGTKWAYKTVNTVSGGKTTLNIIIDNTGKATFGDRNQLRNILGLCKGDGKQAPHIFSWVAGGGHELIQFAAKKHGFHLNELANGIGVAAWRNQPNHNLYDLNLKTKLTNLQDELIDEFGSLDNVPASELATRLKALQDCIREIIIANPTLHLNNLDLNC